MFGLTPLGSYLASSLMQNVLTNLLNNIVVQSIPQTVQISGNITSSDIRETPDSYLLQMSLPGVTKESLSVKYINNYLTITANSDQYVQNGNGGYIRYMGSVNRSFYFDDIDGEKVDGSFENGVLRLILPKVKKQVEEKE
jgi:HSP20 family protein